MRKFKKLLFKRSRRVVDQIFPIGKYDFHDGSIIAIEHQSDEMRIAMESAELCPEALDEAVGLTDTGTIKGILIISGIRTIELDGKMFKGRLEMHADDATILNVDADDSKVHFFVEWANFSQIEPDEQYTDIVIEADSIRWQDHPSFFDPYRLTIIEERFVIPLIILAAPTMKEKLAYPLLSHFRALAELASHTIESYRRGELEEVPRVFSLVERLLNNGENSVKEAATTGFLEGIQNICSHAENGIAAEVFVPYLGPESKRDWDALNEFWNGKTDHSAGHQKK